ncbi:MAG: XRE family transcriptional regulator [Actinomycetota bacterium]|nr:XRE family transcriptional regulator [Actinomycetota bacterium]
MAHSTLAYTEPEVLRWARESTGYSIEEAAHKIGIRWSQLEMAEQGVDYLTLREAEKAAAAYGRPLAALFLPKPPDEEPQEAQFRRLPDAPEPPWPPEMQLLVRRIRERQDAAAELYELVEETPPWPDVVQRFRSDDPAELAALVRDAVSISREEQEAWTDTGGSAQHYAALRGWTDGVEGLGVLVMQDGSLSLDVMRGFASTHDAVPAVVVNAKDDPRARAFTILHELGHLLLASYEPPERLEALCNEFAGELLMPRDWLREAVLATRGAEPRARVDEIARRFSVTPLAAAVRVRRVGLLPGDEVEDVIAEIQARAPVDARAGGGDYYRTTIAQLGPAYIRLVFSALDSQAITYPSASSLLGNVKVNNFDSLRERLDQRGEIA